MTEGPHFSRSGRTEIPESQGDIGGCEARWSINP